MGTPVSNPVWTLDLTKTIDPDVFLGVDEPFPQEAPSIAIDAAGMYAVYTAQDDAGFVSFARLRLCISANLASPLDGWSAITAFNLATDSPPGFNFVGQELVLPAVRVTGSPTQIMLTTDALVPPSASDEARYWMGNFAPPVPPGPPDTQLIKITFRGVKLRRIVGGDDPQLVDVPNLPSVKRAM